MLNLQDHEIVARALGRVTAGKLEELKVIKQVLRKAKGERPKEEGDNPATLHGNHQRAENDWGRSSRYEAAPVHDIIWNFLVGWMAPPTAGEQQTFCLS
jgi:hypothetical protein